MKTCRINKRNFKLKTKDIMKTKKSFLQKIKAFFIHFVMRSSSLKNANSKLNDIEFYDLMQMYRMAEMTDQDKTVKRFETVKEWIRQNYA